LYDGYATLLSFRTVVPVRSALACEPAETLQRQGPPLEDNPLEDKVTQVLPPALVLAHEGSQDELLQNRHLQVHSSHPTLVVVLGGVLVLLRVLLLRLLLLLRRMWGNIH